MKVYKFDSAPFQVQGGGASNKVLHTDSMTLAAWKLDKGTDLARHAHAQEQVAYVLEGRMLFVTDSGEVEVAAGEQIVFAGNEAHGGKALENSIVLDVFSSVREDFKEKFPALEAE